MVHVRCTCGAHLVHVHVRCMCGACTKRPQQAWWCLQLRANAVRVRAGRARVACVPLLVRWTNGAPAAPLQAGGVARRAAAAEAVGAVRGGGGGDQRRGDVSAQEGGELR